jgi:hypothetical protein
MLKKICFLSLYCFAFLANANTWEVHQFDIPRLPLSVALHKISDISEASFLIPYDLVDHKKGKPVNGQYTTQQALDILLEGTGFQGVLSEHRVFLIKLTSTSKHTDKTPKQTKKSLFDTALAFLFSDMTETKKTNSQGAEEITQDDMEQISVTGSYIKRKSYNEVGSPIDFINRNALDADAPNGRLVDLLRFLPMNSGNASGLAPGGDDGAQEGRLGAGTIDIRGLGGGASLVLLNGQRQTGFPLAFDGRVDVNFVAMYLPLLRGQGGDKLKIAVMEALERCGACLL